MPVIRKFIEKITVMKTIIAHFSAVATWLCCWFAEQGVHISGPIAVLSAVLLAGFLPKCERCPTRVSVQREFYEELRQQLDDRLTTPLHYGLALRIAYPDTKTNPYYERTST